MPRKVYDKYRILNFVRNKIKELNKMGIEKTTIRFLFYDLYSAGIIPNTKQAYKSLVYHLTRLREARAIPDEAIVDDERPFYDFFIPMVWSRQKHYIELWVEKRSVAIVLLDIAMMTSIRLLATRGYASRTALVDAVKNRLSKVENKKIHILYVGDFDPSGEDIFRYISEWIENEYPGCSFEKIAVTKKQISEYNLPPLYLGERADEDLQRLRRDPRYKSFVRRHGREYRVEVEALGVERLRDIVLNSILKYIKRIDLEKGRLLSEIKLVSRILAFQEMFDEINKKAEHYEQVLLSSPQIQELFKETGLKFNLIDVDEKEEKILLTKIFFNPFYVKIASIIRDIIRNNSH